MRSKSCQLDGLSLRFQHLGIEAAHVTLQLPTSYATCSSSDLI